MVLPCCVEFCKNYAYDVCESCARPTCEDHMQCYDYTAEQDGSCMELCPTCYAQIFTPVWPVL